MPGLGPHTCFLSDLCNHEGRAACVRVSVTDTLLYIYICVCVCMYVCTYVRMRVCVCVCMYVCTYVYMHIRISVYMYIYIHTYIHVYIHIRAMYLLHSHLLTCFSVSQPRIPWHRKGKCGQHGSHYRRGSLHWGYSFVTVAKACMPT